MATTETRIRAAYATLAPRRGAWIRHTDVRRQLTDVPAARLDEAFARLAWADDVDMMGEANQKILTAEDRRNAVRYGGQDTHLIAIGIEPQALASEAQHQIGTDDGEAVYAEVHSGPYGHRVLFRGLILSTDGVWDPYEPACLFDDEYRAAVNWGSLDDALAAARATLR